MLPLRSCSTNSLGKRGEHAAALYLKRNGFIIWKQNWSCKVGEIDLVAQQGRSLIFVEVKTRASAHINEFNPADAVDQRKQRKLKLLAEIFISEQHAAIRRRRIKSVRFDIISVIYNRRAKLFRRLSVEHLEKAFSW